MTAPPPTANNQSKGRVLPSARSPQSQNGVVLIIALIMLVVISLLAVSSMRGAGSAESIAGNVRTTELATQAAEIALRHCESSAIKITKVLAGDTTSAEATYSTTLVEANILRASTAVQWQYAPFWDNTTTATFVLSTATLALTGGTTTTYKRPPECMIESLTGVTPVGTSASFVITARGFGPEVEAGTGRPKGAEVWLQSTIEIQ